MWKGATVGAAAVGVPALLLIATDPYTPHRGRVAVVILIWVVIAAGYGVVSWLHSQRRNDN